MKRFKKAADIKVGVVGYGGRFNMGRQHLREMQNAGMTPVAVAEINPERLKVAEEDFPGIETYASLGEMLKKSDVNLITLITPHNTHAKLALQALNAGRHVVCEKPLAITTAECDRMIAAAKKNKVVLTTYHNRHWDGCALQAVKTIRSGAIGEIVRVEAQLASYRRPGEEWRFSKSISGGVLYDWGVHLLEYSLQLIDAGITEVSGYAHTGYWAKQCAWKDDTSEDLAMAAVRFDTGQWLTLVAGSVEACTTSRPGVLTITGTKGTYVMGFETWEIHRCENDEQVIVRGDNPKSESWQYYKNVADHLAKGKKLVITSEWARRPIHILDLADRSAKAGKALKATYK